MTESEMLEAEEYWCEKCCNFDREHIRHDGFAKCRFTNTLAYAEEFGKDCRAFNKPAENAVILPCKVGDKLYAISENRIAECICDEINIHNEVNICAEFQCDYDCKGCPFNAWKQDFYTGEYSCDGEYGTWFFSLKDFGKTVFLTKEEAEQTLRKEDEGK